MNWGAVLFLCALASRVRGPAGKNGGVSNENTPVFWRKPPIFPSRLPIFRARWGSVRCAVWSDAQFLAHRGKTGAEAACQSGRRARRSGGE